MYLPDDDPLGSKHVAVKLLQWLFNNAWNSLALVYRTAAGSGALSCSHARNVFDISASGQPRDRVSQQFIA